MIMRDIVTIRPASANDHAAIVRLAVPVQEEHAQAVPTMFRAGGTPLPITYFHELLASSDAEILVADDANYIVGFVILKVQDAPAIPILQPRRTAIVDIIAVDTSRQGQGIGTALMNAALVWARDQGADELELIVHEFNTSAIGFYEHLGLRTTRRRMSLPLISETPVGLSHPDD
jgi:ribosomal protein S18 acetylase RimI-like enzyme